MEKSNVSISKTIRSSLYWNILIKKLIGLLDTSNLELRRDVKQSLSNIAEYPEGFSIITAKLASNFKFLNDV